jgi:O-methyltransferase involved in polyketide biosynthesis
LEARRDLFGRLSKQATKVLVITEGLIIYFTEQQVADLARDLAVPAAFQRWVTDLASPSLVKMLQSKMGSKLSEGNAKLQFGPEAGPEFFRPFGWQPRDAQSLMHTAAKFGRLPFLLRLISLVTKPGYSKSSKPWGGVCLLAKE